MVIYEDERKYHGQMWVLQWLTGLLPIMEISYFWYITVDIQLQPMLDILDTKRILFWHSYDSLM